MTDAGLRALLADCLVLWAIEGRVRVTDAAILVESGDDVFTVQRADPGLRPARWFLQTPERRQANRPPRAIPSVVALLSALRNQMGGDGGNRLRIGA